MKTPHLDALLDRLPNGISADPALDLKLLKDRVASLEGALRVAIAAIPQLPSHGQYYTDGLIAQLKKEIS